MLTRSGEHRTTASQFHFRSVFFVSATLAAADRKTPFPLAPYYPHQIRATCFSSVFPTSSVASDDERANSNQLIFYSTRVPAFVVFASRNSVRMQLYNTGLVTLSSSSSSSSPLFILLLCEQTAGLLFFFFCKSYHYSSLQAQELHSKSLMEAYLVESGLEMRLPWGYGHKGGVGGGWLLDDKHTEAHICAHNHVQKDMTQNNTSICVLSSFRLSGLVIVLILGHIYTTTLSHSVKELCTQQ